jgi:hypothetical protein
MRTLSAAALAAINLPNPKFILFAKIVLNSTTLLVTSSPSNHLFNSETYLSTSSLVSFGPPRISSSVDREVYELIFLDHDNSIQQALRTGITGKKVTVYAAFYNSSNVLLNSVNDVLVAYEGLIDSGKVVNDGSVKQAIISVASPMATLDSIGGYIVSRDGMDQVSSTDTSFDEVYVGGETVNLKWGKD